MSESSIEIDPAVDQMARLWQHLCQVELGIHKLIIDRESQHTRPEFIRTFQVLLEVAQAQGLTPRRLLDHLIAGAKRQRRRDPTFQPRTRDLVTPSYRRWLLRAPSRPASFHHT